MNFNKKPKTFAEQITLLKQRGLTIEDESKAEHHLSNISYYRLSAYFLSFQKYGDPNHSYVQGATFNKVIETYVFDRELRAILLDAIERIEVSLRCRIVYAYCHSFGNNWYEDSTLFLREHAKFMKVVVKELNGSKETFIEHYRKKYTSPINPPAWMAMEVLSFGQLSTMFKNLKSNHAKKQVSTYFGVSNTVLESWMEHLVYIRNLCAHHSRLWNRTMTIKAIVPNLPSYRWISLAPAKPNKVYTTLCITAYLLERVTVKAPFSGKVKTLLNRFPEIDIKLCGFDSKWQSDVFWNHLHVHATYRARIIIFKFRNMLKRKKIIS